MIVKSIEMRFIRVSLCVVSFAVCVKVLPVTEAVANDALDACKGLEYEELLECLQRLAEPQNVPDGPAGNGGKGAGTWVGGGGVGPNGDGVQPNVKSVPGADVAKDYGGVGELEYPMVLPQIQFFPGYGIGGTQPGAWGGNGGVGANGDQTSPEAYRFPNLGVDGEGGGNWLGAEGKDNRIQVPGVEWLSREGFVGAGDGTWDGTGGVGGGLWDGGGGMGNRGNNFPGNAATQ